MSTPLVSVVLVTRNGGDRLAAVLAAIARQRADFAYDVVAVDSGSTDGTVELLERVAGQVITVPPESFNHGATRNLGIEHARGELVVLLVQDALPTGDEWLDTLSAPLRADPRVAGAFCRQQPRPDATALTRHHLAQWVAASATPRSVGLASPGQLDQLDPAARLRLCAFDNVCACIRRSVWQEFPFAHTPIAEDLEWAKAVLLAGYRLDYVPDAVVLHSHERSARYEFARTYVLHHQLARLFGLRTIPTLRALAHAVVSSGHLHLACERQGAREGRPAMGRGRALALAAAWPLGQYLGGLSGARGWKPIRFTAV